MKKLMVIILSVVFFASSAQAFDMKDLNRTVDKSYKCKKGDKKCKNKEHAKAAVKVAAIAVAATIIAKMIINHKTKKVDDDQKVAEEYKKTHKTLPDQAFASEYVTRALPGKVVQPGKEVTIKSEIVVVPGAKNKSALIEEKIVIFDNEDNTKELKSLTKAVNEKTKKAGRYENEFSFTLPEGMPQGVYPIKTELMLNGKVVDSSDTGIQLVLNLNSQGEMVIAFAN